MISLILLKLFTFSQILQGVPKLSHATVYIYIYTHTVVQKICNVFFNVIYFSDANQNFLQPLRQSSVSHSPSEIILIC